MPMHWELVQVRGHATEERILREVGTDNGPSLWDMPPGAPTEAIEQVLHHFRKRQDVRQEARALNCLALMHSEAGAVERAIPPLQLAIQHCRSALLTPSAAAGHSEAGGTEEGNAAEEVEFWAEGLMTCVANLACVLLRAGHAQGALERLRESVEISGQRGDVAAQARNMAKISLVLAARSDLTGAIKVGRGALDMLSATGGWARQAALCFSLASVYLSLGELRLAVESLESSLVLRRKARDKVSRSSPQPVCCSVLHLAMRSVALFVSSLTVKVESKGQDDLRP